MERRTLSQRLVRSAVYPLIGGAAMAGFVAWSQQHWWVGPVVLAAVLLFIAVLWRW